MNELEEAGFKDIFVGTELWRSLGRPSGAKKGTYGFNTDTNAVEVYDGSNWH